MNRLLEVYRYFSMYALNCFASIKGYLRHFSYAIVNSLHLEPYEYGGKYILKAITMPLTKLVVEVCMQIKFWSSLLIIKNELFLTYVFLSNLYLVYASQSQRYAYYLIACIILIPVER